MTTPCVLELEGVPIPVWQAEFTTAVIHGGGAGGPGGPAAWGSITGTIASQADLMAALAAKANTATLAPVATSGAYADLTGTPMLGTAAAANLGDFAPTVHAHLAASIADSTPIGRALLTAVDAAAARSAIGVAAPAWGGISGTLSAQVDLSAALAGKLSAASNLGDLTNAAAARINLGLGSAAQSAASSFATSTQGGKADTALQPGAGLAAIDSAAANKLAGVQAGATANATDAQLRDRSTHTGTQDIATITGLSAAIAAKQDVLVAGSSIKTINGQSPLGAGNLVISGGGGGGPAAWADITGKPWLLTPGGWQAAILHGRGGTITAVGTLPDVVTTGTTTHPDLNTASLRQSLPRFTITSAATAGSSFDLIGRNLLMTRGDAAGLGGFTQTIRFSVSDTTSARRGFIGMRGSATGWTGASFAPNGVALCVGVGFDAAIHANYQIAHAAHTNNSGSYVDTGIPLSNPESVLELTLSCPPNGDDIYWALKDINSGASASGAISTNIPNKQTFYSPRVRMDNNGAAVAVSCDVMGIWMSNYLG